jgi:hypothetical protein
MPKINKSVVKPILVFDKQKNCYVLGNSVVELKGKS